MFFLITHITVGKYYTNFFTQFVIGCTCYMIFFLMLRDLISSQTYEKYKYYIFILIFVDLSFIIYKAKICNKNDTKLQTISVVRMQPEQISSTDLPTGSTPSITFSSSEVNDFKITHANPSSSDDYDQYSLFSSENKSPTNPEEPDKQKDKTNLVVPLVAPEQSVTTDNSSMIPITSISINSQS